MKSTTRILFCVSVMITLAACSVFVAYHRTGDISGSSSIISSVTPFPTLISTRTPIPSPTFTPTLPPPTATPTITLTPTKSATSIPIDVQQSIFEDLWAIVNDTYVYPDFNGLDWNAIHQEYLQKISAGMTTTQFYQAMAEVIHRLGDDHSAFLTPQDVKEADAEYQGNLDYVGIGILVSAVPERHHAVILSVFPGSPAHAAGLKPRDSIISVDGSSILDQNGFLQDIVRGPEGTTIHLVVQTPGERSRTISITRQRIVGEVPVDHTVITTPEGKRIGYIFLFTFEDSTVDDQVASILEEMTADAPLDGLILDNRMNSGGSSTVIEPILSYFIGGELGYHINHGEERPMQVRLNNINGSSKVPLVVLVGKETASFGEIFAGILQDMNRAYLIGTTTNGNVEILWTYDMEDGSRLILANETFVPYNHPEQDWEKTGIIPDLTVAGEFDEYQLDNDPAVLAALQYLSTQ